MRAEELLAISETIKMLNDDDSLELFKKTLVTPSFMQVAVKSKDVRHEALLALHQNGMPKDARLKLVALALRAKKVSFEKVLKMIENMVDLLGKEQTDDDDKKDYCNKKIDEAEDKMKALMQEKEDLEKAIAESNEKVTSLTEEIATLTQGIKDLDKAVAESTEQRKEENENYLEDLAANKAAEELLTLAKNRLAKFYDPKLYSSATAASGLSDEEQVYSSFGGEVLAQVTTATPGDEHTQVSAGISVFEELAGQAASFLQVSDQQQPPPPPETFGEYDKKSEAKTEVFTLIDMLMGDLNKDMAEAKSAEKEAQTDYEETMKMSVEKRASDAKAITEKEAAKAGLEEQLLKIMSDHKFATESGEETATVIQNLHKECDWLLENYVTRKEARASEVESLHKAEAVLSGADYSFLQTSESRQPVHRVEFLHAWSRARK